MDISDTPYAPPSADLIKTDGVQAQAEEIREQHIKHESSLRSVGTLYYLGAAMLLMGGAGMAFFAVSVPRSGAADFGFVTGFGVLYLFLGAIGIVLGRGLRRLKRWVKVPIGILSGIGLLGFPIGTVISAYILYLVFGKKGKMVFSDEYREIIELTPDIKYRTSVVVWAFLILILLAVAAAVIMPVYIEH